jgi:1-acyl-sn-glycerol-3-phosphate acyltransferase
VRFLMFPAPAQSPHSTSMTKMKRSLVKTWFIIIQILTIPANLFLTKLLRLKVDRPSDFKITHGTLIIANHQSRVDPFLISTHIGFKNLHHTLPIRYPVTPEYMHRPILGFCIRLLGGYNIGNDPLERLKKLIFTRSLLKHGYSVVLFPEGKITRDKDMVNDFKKGANNHKHRLHFWKNKVTKLSYSTYYGPEVSREEKIAAMMLFFNSVTHTE